MKVFPTERCSEYLYKNIRLKMRIFNSWVNINILCNTLEVKRYIDSIDAINEIN